MHWMALFMTINNNRHKFVFLAVFSLISYTFHWSVVSSRTFVIGKSRPLSRIPKMGCQLHWAMKNGKYLCNFVHTALRKWMNNSVLFHTIWRWYNFKHRSINKNSNYEFSSWLLFWHGAALFKYFTVTHKCMKFIT